MHSPDLTTVPSLLLAWYDQNARVLPWRSDPAPYRVWVSEIMLQQTRVEAVIAYFERFMEALPDIPSLAKADEQHLLKLWEGLGYYSRVRNLQKAARVVMEQHGGELPDDPALLRALPGLGAYSAGAVASIAFGRRETAVDGNVLRVMARLTADEGDIANTAVKRRIGELVKQLLPKARVGDFNQALMELGAMVCLPNGAPKCDCCPLSTLCAAHLAGITHRLPAKKTRTARRREDKTVLVLICNEKVALLRRANTGLLAGLWELPNLEGSLSPEETAAVLAAQGVACESLRPLGPAKHIFTHIEWHMTGYLANISAGAAGGDYTWVSASELAETYALPTAFSAYTSFIWN